MLLERTWEATLQGESWTHIPQPPISPLTCLHTALSLVRVAPEAKLRAYRIDSCTGDGPADDMVISAMVAASQDSCDVINLSLGRPAGWPDGPVPRVASRLVGQGTPVVIAAGNAGLRGAFFGLSPSAASAATSVASIDNTALPVYSAYVQSGGTERAVSLLTLNPLDVPAGKLRVKVVDPSPDALQDACDASKVAAAGPFDGSVVVINLSDCFDSMQFSNLAAAGAKFVLVYGKPPPAGDLFVETTHAGQQVASLFRADGIFIKQQVASGAAVEIDFSRQTSSVATDVQNGGRISFFSTTTPYWDLSSLTLAAPGGNVPVAGRLGKSGIRDGAR